MLKLINAEYVEKVLVSLILGHQLKQDSVIGASLSRSKCFWLRASVQCAACLFINKADEWESTLFAKFSYPVQLNVWDLGLDEFELVWYLSISVTRWNTKSRVLTTQLGLKFLVADHSFRLPIHAEKCINSQLQSILAQKPDEVEVVWWITIEFELHRPFILCFNKYCTWDYSATCTIFYILNEAVWKIVPCIFTFWGAVWSEKKFVIC